MVCMAFLPILPLMKRPMLQVFKVASSAGRDLRFTDSTGGTLLPYQIDEWAPGGDSRIQVKIPEIKPSVEGNTTITGGE